MVSNETNVRRLRSRNNTIFFSLLLLTATLNTSQAIVLCLGCDGHMEIERVGHDCCTRALQTRGSRATNSHVDVTAHVSDALCQSCVDIPVGDGACVKPTTSRTSKTNRADFAVLWPLLQTSGCDAADVIASALLVPTVAHHTSLRGIVLQM
jgi:hypothetical protein